MRFVPLATRPSGITQPPALVGFPAITEDPAKVRAYQRILQGLGFSVGPHGADGRWGADTANAVRNFQTWHNTEPTEPAPRLVVDGLLGPATQSALWYHNARGSDAVVAQVPVVVSPAPVPTPSLAGSTPVGASWNRSTFLDPTVTLGTTTQTATSPWTVVAGITALVGVSLAVANYLQTRRSRR